MSSEQSYDDVSHPFPPKSGQHMNGYTLEELLKSSRNCWVFVCHLTSDTSQRFVTKIAVKTEYKKLLNEIHCYKVLDGGKGIPRLHYHKQWSVESDVGDYTEVAMIVIDRLDNVFNKTSKVKAKCTLPAEQLIPMAVQQISLLEYIHNKGLTHRGVKPDNFVVSEDRTTVYIIDFNKSKPYLDSNGNHKPYRRVESKRPRGLPFFHSVNYHNGVRRSRRDDMESLLYCWVYLFHGTLPWSDVKRYENQFKTYVKNIGKRVNETSYEQICAGLPHNFERYLTLCREMDFYAQPNYQLMRQLISDSLIELNNNSISNDSQLN
ncbi:unnamed protein product [Oppiella nova]|uniref:Protein kinase domain-containing protein n=1 Tax=Oppiella nova TaxID=334625 RepID=A0A7R9MIM2_9ACAR|nr:unnamed protein product [Oppiella nova]CAG2178045.1 unnamed protein product [Oppiella nova]